MSGIKKTVQKFSNASLGRGFHTNREVRSYKADKVARGVTAAKNKMFSDAALPDELDIRRTERRKAAKRRSARAKTILTDRDTLG
jgi:hypothetical protein